MNIDSKPMITVKVTPLYNAYETPLIDFGLSQSQIITKLGKPGAETSSTIGYSSSRPNTLMTMYVFDDNNNLESSAVVLAPTTPNSADHLIERYLPISVDNDTYTSIMINSFDIDNALVVGLMPYELTYWMVIYMPYASLTKSSDFNIDLQRRADELIKSIN